MWHRVQTEQHYIAVKTRISVVLEETFAPVDLLGLKISSNFLSTYCACCSVWNLRLVEFKNPN